MAAKNGVENNFGQKVPDDSMCILRTKHFVKITLSDTVSEINALFTLPSKFVLYTNKCPLQNVNAPYRQYG